MFLIWFYYPSAGVVPALILSADAKAAAGRLAGMTSRIHSDARDFDGDGIPSLRRA